MLGPQSQGKEAARKQLEQKKQKQKTTYQHKTFDDGAVAICALLGNPHVNLHNFYAQFQLCVASVWVHFLIVCVCCFAKWGERVM